MKARTGKLSAVPATLEHRDNRADVANILEEDEIKQVSRDRSAEDVPDETEEDEAVEEEEDDELDEEDDVVRAAEANRN
jgi:hypothetical protein